MGCEVIEIHLLRSNFWHHLWRIQALKATSGIRVERAGNTRRRRNSAITNNSCDLYFPRSITFKLDKARRRWLRICLLLLFKFLGDEKVTVNSKIFRDFRSVMVIEDVERGAGLSFLGTGPLSGPLTWSAKRTRAWPPRLTWVFT